MLACCEGLKLGTEYEMIVVAINAHGENEVKMNNMRAMTSGIGHSVSSLLQAVLCSRVCLRGCEHHDHSETS